MKHDAGYGALNPNKRFDRLVGMTKDAAVKEIEDAGFEARIGPGMTCDYNTKRVTLDLEDDIVKNVLIG